MIHPWKCTICRTRTAEYLRYGTSYCPECLNGDTPETEPETEAAELTLWQRLRGAKPRT